MGPLDTLLVMLSPEVIAAAISVLVFGAVVTVTLVIGASLSADRDIRHRVAESGTLPGAGASPADGARAALRASQTMIENAARHILPSDKENQKKLRLELIRAGFYQPRAAAYYFLSRSAMAAIAGLAGFVLAPDLFPGRSASFHWMVCVVLFFVGYALPRFYMSRRIRSRVAEHRTGFPDLLDLLVVCADAGMSTEAAIDRVARELALAYPSLSANLSLAAIELRAGSPLMTALENLADRLVLPEARSFSTLLKQSQEYGTSLTDSLRVYSDDMRHQRMSRAEEKANSLATKLTVPLMLFIFPIILVVVMLPAVVRLKEVGF
jgi:tight adherence protein C